VTSDLLGNHLKVMERKDKQTVCFITIIKDMHAVIVPVYPLQYQHITHHMDHPAFLLSN
jgi:hypothetical protein